MMSAGLYLGERYPEMRLPLPLAGLSVQEWMALRQAFLIIDACVTLCVATE
jgi:hypothetical protein